VAIRKRPSAASIGTRRKSNVRKAQRSERSRVKEAEMRTIGSDLHAAQQKIAMLDCESGDRRRIS
jgi:hypothetical protein